MSHNPLLTLRDKITALDKQLLQLIAQRRELSTQVVNTKIKANIPVRDIERERLLVKTLIEEGNQFSLDELFVKRLYQIIIEDSVLLQQRILQQQLNQNAVKSAKIAFLGPKGSYSHSQCVDTLRIILIILKNLVVQALKIFLKVLIKDWSTTV